MIKLLLAAVLSASFLFGRAMADDLTKYDTIEDLSILELEANLSRDRNNRNFDSEIFTDTVRDLYLRVAYAIYAADLTKSIQCSEVWENELNLAQTTAKEVDASEEDVLRYSEVLDIYKSSLNIAKETNNKFSPFLEKHNPTIDLLVSYTVLYVNKYEYYEGFTQEFREKRRELYKKYNEGLGIVSSEIASSDCKGDFTNQTTLYQTYQNKRVEFFELLFHTLKTE